MHIVCQRKDLNQTQALMDPTGFAVLAFFVDVRSTVLPFLLRYVPQRRVPVVTSDDLRASL